MQNLQQMPSEERLTVEAKSQPPSSRRGRKQYGVRSLFLLTTVSAMLLSVCRVLGISEENTLLTLVLFVFSWWMLYELKDGPARDDRVSETESEGVLTRPAKKPQFAIRDLLVLTTLLALAMSAWRTFPESGFVLFGMAMVLLAGRIANWICTASESDSDPRAKNDPS